MTVFVPAYDTERMSGETDHTHIPACIDVCKEIARLHREWRIPATFFLVGETLKKDEAAFRDLLSDPLFEVASHTWSHKLLMDHPVCGKAASIDQIRIEILESKRYIEQVFQRECTGFRAAVGFTNGFKGKPDLLALVKDAGYRYISTMLWGPDYSLPAPLTQSFTYESDGFPQIREFPGHGWHENVLKGSCRHWGVDAMRVLLFPPLIPEAIPPHFVENPKEEFAWNNKVFIDKAVESKSHYVSLIWHPWSIGLFDPAMEMLKMTFEYVQTRGIKTSTFSTLCDRN